MASLILSIAVAVSLATPSPPTPATTPAAPTHAPAAVAAYERARACVRDGDDAEAVAQLDIAEALAPTWTAPVRLRAEVFGTLARRHHPSETFTAARAADLQRLRELEPDVEADARQAEIDRLRRDSSAAAAIEARRRKLTTPALIFGSVAVGVFLGGALLYSMTPREFLQPTAYRQYRRDRAGITLMAVGGAMIVPAVVIGVLAGRQARNDAFTREFEVQTGRRRALASLAPQLLRRGGGLGVHLRF